MRGYRSSLKLAWTRCVLISSIINISAIQALATPAHSKPHLLPPCVIPRPRRGRDVIASSRARQRQRNKLGRRCNKRHPRRPPARSLHMTACRNTDTRSGRLPATIASTPSLCSAKRHTTTRRCSKCFGLGVLGMAFLLGHDLEVAHTMKAWVNRMQKWACMHACMHACILQFAIGHSRT